MTRLEGSRRGRIALSVVIVLFLLAITTANVPLKRFHDQVRKVDDPVLAALGARQVWSVFAPDPQQVVSTLEVRFTYRDGTTSTWRIRKRNPFTGAYRDYRWLKLAENAARSQAAGTGLLRWATRQHALPKPLAKAELVRSVYDIAPPGRPERDHAPAERGVLYVLQAGGG
jgi:hypothetical protein